MAVARLVPRVCPDELIGLGVIPSPAAVVAPVRAAVGACICAVLFIAVCCSVRVNRDPPPFPAPMGD